jgi:hypothetical protein
MISPFIRAHGYIPGPTDRPVVTGLITGAAALVPGIALAWAGRGLPEAASALNIAPALAMLEFAVVLAVSGAVYGWIFMRAANDPKGGWLFGIGYGFFTWMLGPATILQWTTGRPIALGAAAQSLLGAHLVYGLVLGMLYPHVGAALRRWPLRSQ